MLYAGDAAAANDESFVTAVLAPETLAQLPTSGWSAFEVWRKRIWETHGPGPRET
jgi:hypothetical protein